MMAPDTNNETVKSMLRPRDTLYGRSAEISNLLGVYRRATSNSSSESKMDDDSEDILRISANKPQEVVLISGNSGTGKTALAHTLRKPVVTDGGYYIHGKFDQLDTAEPYSAIISAFAVFCDLVLAEEEGTNGQKMVQDNILNAVGAEAKVLTDIIPSLEKVIGIQEAGAEVRGAVEARNRFNFVFKKFVSAVSSPEHPMVLLLDDLQWADAASLELLCFLFGTDDSAVNDGFLFVGTFRDSEVFETDKKTHHPCAAMLEELERRSGIVTITKIGLSNLSIKSVNEMLSDILHVPHETTRPLTEIVHQKTLGNLFFIFQFLSSLFDAGLLHFVSDDDGRWTWDSNGIVERDFTNNIVALVAAKIRMLPTSVQNALKVAACTGVDFDEVTLKYTLMNSPSDESDDLSQILAYLVDKGLIEKLPQSDGAYRFAHDRIQQAAYSLIPKEEQEAFHLGIGRRLLDNASSDTILEDKIFVVVNQLNRGSKLIKDPRERGEVARLNLRAGSKAMLSSAFRPAATFLKAGIGYLESDNCWQKHYKLCLDLFNAAAEAEYCNANFETMDRLLEAVLQNATSFPDKLHASSTRVISLGAQDKLQDAIDTGFVVLQQLGEPFPSQIHNSTILLDFMKTKWKLRGKTDEKLYNLPSMENPGKLAAMQMLHLLFFYTYIVRVEAAPLVINRAVRLSVQYGVCAMSTFAFAGYGMILCDIMDDIDGAYRFGQLALLLLDRFQAKEWIARVYFSVYGYLNIWKKHVSESLGPLLYAYKVGMETGDIEYAMLCAEYYCLRSFESGLELERVEKYIRKFCKRMSLYKQEACLNLSLPFWQMILNLMGQADDPLMLTGEAMEQEQMIKEATEKDSWVLSNDICLYRMILAYIFGDYALAGSMADKCRGMEEGANIDTFTRAFFEGLTAFALARVTKQRKWRVIGGKNTKKMKRWAQYSPENCLHKWFLLQAELAVSKKNHRRADELFAQAAEKASEQGFIHEQAITLERSGIHQLQRGNKPGASVDIRKAYLLYAKWGAHGKVEHLEVQYPFL